MSKEEAILISELLEACHAALAFIEHAGPENFILGDDEPVKGLLAAAIARVDRFYKGEGQTIH